LFWLCKCACSKCSSSPPPLFFLLPPPPLSGKWTSHSCGIFWHLPQWPRSALTLAGTDTDSGAFRGSWHVILGAHSSILRSVEWAAGLRGRGRHGFLAAATLLCHVPYFFLARQLCCGDKVSFVQELQMRLFPRQLDSIPSTTVHISSCCLFE